MRLVDFHGVRVPEFVRSVLLVAPALTAPCLWVDAPLLALSVARAACLEREEPVELLVAVAPFPPHRPWPFLAVVGAVLPTHHALKESQKRVLEEPVHLVYQVRRPKNVPPLPALVAVLLPLL